MHFNEYFLRGSLNTRFFQFIWSYYFVVGVASALKYRVCKNTSIKIPMVFPSSQKLVSSTESSVLMGTKFSPRGLGRITLLVWLFPKCNF